MRLPAYMRKALCALTAALTALTIASCATDFRAEAVEKAREYALDNMRDIPETQRDFIRYTDPQIMDQIIFMNGSKRTSRNNYMHTCMVWDPPGMDGRLVIAGFGDKMMREWNPTRIVIKEFPVADPLRREAIRKAVSYAMDRMLYLSDSERNRIRFSTPDILKTSFEISEEDKEPEKQKPLSRWERYLKSLEKKRESTQFSVVWDADKEGQRVVVSGFASKDMKGWNPKSGMLTSSSDLKLHLVTSPSETVLEKPDATAERPD